jgi:hypothetical protein
MRCRGTALLLLGGTLLAGLDLRATEPAKRRPAGTSRATKLEKCEECRTSLRRRLSVMPVALEGAAATGVSWDALEAIPARLRELLSRHENLHALEPAEIAMASENAGGTAADAGGTRGPRRPLAQAELFLTVSNLGIATELENEPAPAVENALKEAVDLENQADLLRAEAARRESRIEEAARSAALAASGDVDKEAALECRDAAARSMACGGDFDCIARGQQQIHDCQDSVRNRQVQKGARAAEEERSRLGSEAMGIRAESESLKARAGVLRRNAALEAETAARVTRRVRVELSVGWRLVDSRWGVLIKADAAKAARAREEKGLPKAAVASETQGRASGEAVINEAVDAALEKIAAQVSDAMGAVGPRVKVVKAEASEVTINAGSALGAAVGDTFGLVSRAAVLTDPDTGRPLEAPPGPSGKYRVVKVAEHLSTLSAVERSGQPRRGDELEWIGVYGPYATTAGRPGPSKKGD